MRRVLKQFFALCLVLIFLTGCQAGKQEVVIQINNRQVTKPEFMLYLYEVTQDFKMIGGEDIWETDFDGQSAEDLVKERTLTTLQNVILTTQQAENYHVSLTEEDRQTAKTNADSEWEKMTPEEQKQIGISKDKLYGVMEDTLLYQKVYEEVTKDYQLSHADFQVYFTENKQKYQDYYTKYTLSSILVKEKSTAQEVVKKARAGEDFHDLFQQYELDDEEKSLGGTLETYKANLESVFGVEFNLKQGEISEPLKQEEGYFIFKVEEKNVPDGAKLSELAQADYTNGMKKKLFDSEFQGWLEQSNIQKNEEVWNTIQVIRS